MLSWRPDYGNSLCGNKNIVLFKLEYLAVQVMKELGFEGKKHSFLMNIH